MAESEKDIPEVEAGVPEVVEVACEEIEYLYAVPPLLKKSRQLTDRQFQE